MAPDPSPPASPVLVGRDSPDLPLTMTASTVLMALPRDATTALAAAGGFPLDKVVVRFKPVGSAPPIRRELVKVASAHKFESVVAYLRKTLKVAETESVFLYINSTFAPALDEVVGNLWRVGGFGVGWVVVEADVCLCYSASKTPTSTSTSRTR